MIKVCPRCGKKFEVSEENRIPIYEVITRKGKNGKDNVLKFRDSELAEDCYNLYEDQGYALLVLQKIVFTNNGDEVEILKSNTDVVEALIDNDDGTPVDTEICPSCEVDEEIADAWVDMLKKYSNKRR